MAPRTYIRVGETGAVGPGMEKAKRCKYILVYYDLETGKRREWKCDMPALPGRDYCLFHDPDYWKEQPERVIETFYRQVKEATGKERPAYSIGYNLPVALKEVEIRDVVFKGDVFLTLLGSMGPSHFLILFFMDVLAFYIPNLLAVYYLIM